MKLTLEQLRKEIRNALNEYGAPRGKLRKPGAKSAGKMQFKPGYVEDQNAELTSWAAEKEFPKSVEAWIEIVPEIFPDFPFKDDFSIKKHTLWFRIGSKLRVAFENDPTREVAEWQSEIEDWKEI